MPLGKDPLTDYAVERVAGRLMLARERAGLTRERLAQKIGISYSSVANFEAGRQDMPLSRILAYLRATGADPAWVFKPADSLDDLPG
jgi:transcriptional regulator with XRE-family HTH domain